MDAESSATVNVPQNEGYIRLKEIEIAFMGRTSLSAITFRLQVDDGFHDFKPEVRTRTVKWDCGIYVSQRSKITLIICRVKSRLHNPFKDSVISNIVLETGDSGVRRNSVHTCADPRVRANFTFAESIDRNTFIDLMGDDVRSALASKVILLDRMKNVTAFLKVVFNVGKEVSELNDIAKVVFGLANKLFKVLQEQQEFHHMAVDLAELLNVKLHLSEIIPEKLRQGSVQKSLKEMLDVIEEALKFIQAHISSRSLNGLVERRGKLTDLKAKLFAASEDLSLCLTTNILVMVSDVHQNMHDTILEKKLKPVLPARSSVDHRCLEGTREAPLEDIANWAKAITLSKFYHVHGIAGSGKSSMASTVCEILEREKILAGAFFCKRDIPDQRDLNRILPSLSYTLALRHAAYREILMRSLGDEPDITSRSVEQQLKVLFREPLAKLAQNENQPKSLVFVIDALDECGDDASRPKMVESLCQIAAIADWLRVFVTSRPLDDIMRSMTLSSSGKVTSVDVNALDSKNDIKLYTSASLKELVQRYGLGESWLNEDITEMLTSLASGLFIWTSTMMRFVRGQLDKDKAMGLILSGHAAAAETSLDDLYIKVIESCGSGDDNLRLIKMVLGIVFITAKNRPLSIDGLNDFLQKAGQEVSKGTLVAVIDHLRSVLYEDISQGNAIRVCHPSFLDFLESHERCGVYWTNVEQLHASMAETGLNLMKTKLKFNICGLESSYAANKDVSDLSQRIMRNIPESLIYSCLYWATHLTEANRMTIEPLVVSLLRSLDAIYWVEVLSLVGGVIIGLDALQTVIDFFKDNNALCSLATDLRRLISSSNDAISYSTPHLYISALSWLPESSPLRSVLSRVKADDLIASGRNKGWSSMSWMSTLGGDVNQVAFSSNNQSIAACSDDSGIAIFDAKSGVLGMKLQVHGGVVWTIAFSPDERRLASGSSNRSVIIWDLRTGDIIGQPLIGHSDTVISVAYSPDGRFIASRSWDGEIRVWDSQSGAAIRVMEGCQEYGRLAFSYDGSKLACCGAEGIIIRDAQSGELLDELSDIGHILSIAYSQDGRFLASGGEDCMVRVWNTETLDSIVELEGHASNVYSVIFSSDGSTLFSASDEGKMVRWDMSSRRMSGVAVHESNILSAACSSDGQLYAAASEDGSLRVWNAESHFRTESLSVNDRLRQVPWSPEGNEIASASSSGEIRIHSLGSGSLLRTLKGHIYEVITVVYSPDGKLLASGSEDCTVRVWDAATGLELRQFKGHTGWVSAVIFLSDGKHVVSSSADGTVRCWNIDDDATDEELLLEQPSPIRSTCVSLNGGLAFGDDSGCILFGDLPGGEIKELRIEPSSPVRSLSFSPDENYIASGSEDYIIRLWHLETLTEVRTFNGHLNFVLSISFSRDGQQLLSSSGDGTIRQWCVDTGEEIRQLNGHINIVWHSAYSVDEKHIISCSFDGTIRIWNANAKEDTFISEIDQSLSSLELRDGWIKSKIGELLLWVPSEYRNGLRDMCIRCIPADAPGHLVSLDWSKLVKGDNWTSVLDTTREITTS